MNIQSAVYLKSLVPGASLPERNLPVFAFIGRSNAGKSSFINTITNQKNLARSGSTPGVTQKVNLFMVNKKCYFADLPGYGYAKLSRHERKALEEIIFWYLSHTEIKFQQIFLLIDSRVGPTDSDVEMIDFLNHHHLPLIIIATKIDKLKSSERSAQLKKITTSIPGHQIIPFSSHNGEGKKEVLELMTLANA